MKIELEKQLYVLGKGGEISCDGTASIEVLGHGVFSLDCSCTDTSLVNITWWLLMLVGATLDAQGLWRHFHIGNGCSLVLRGLTLVNGKASHTDCDNFENWLRDPKACTGEQEDIPYGCPGECGGGSIKASGGGTLLLDSTTISTCEAVTSSGGAINAENMASVELIDSNISACTADHVRSDSILAARIYFSPNPATAQLGGAIKTSHGTKLTLRRTRIQGGHAKKGGCIALGERNEYSLTIIHSLVEKAYREMHPDLSREELNSLLESKYADHTLASTLVLDSSELSDCSASQDGGGVHAMAMTTLELSGSAITASSAGNRGGGLFASNEDACYLEKQSDLACLTLPASISALNITNCSATIGGGMHLIDTDTLVNLGSSISDNIASGDSGGLFQQGGTLDLADSVFEGNEANGESATQDGEAASALHFDIGSGSVRNTAFTSNRGKATIIYRGSNVKWHCQPGRYMPEAGQSAGDFVGCSELCAAGYYGDRPDYTIGTCGGLCPVGKYCESGTSPVRLALECHPLVPRTLAAAFRARRARTSPQTARSIASRASRAGFHRSWRNSSARTVRRGAIARRQAQQPRWSSSPAPLAPIAPRRAHPTRRCASDALLAPLN